MLHAGPRVKRGGALRRRMQRGRDEFGVTLAFGFLILLVAPFEVHAVRPPLVALQTLMLLFTLWTSAAPRRLIAIVAGVGVLSFGVILTNEVRSDGAVIHVGFTAVSMVLLLATIVVVAARTTAHPRVSVQTVSGALSIYVLAGLLFAYLDVFEGEVRDVAFFAQPGTHSPVAFIYYSFATLTTVGYGDLSAADDFGRMISVIEALLGQLYLVTVVALVVANVGRARHNRSDDRSHPDS